MLSSSIDASASSILATTERYQSVRVKDYGVRSTSRSAIIDDDSASVKRRIDGAEVKEVDRPQSSLALCHDIERRV